MGPLTRAKVIGPSAAKLKVTSRMMLTKAPQSCSDADDDGDACLSDPLHLYNEIYLGLIFAATCTRLASSEVVVLRNAERLFLIPLTPAQSQLPVVNLSWSHLFNSTATHLHC